MAGVVGAPVVEVTQLVVAQQRGRGVLPGQLDHLAAVRSATDEVAEENETVVLLLVELVEQVGKFLVAPVDVTDSDESAAHGEKRRARSMEGRARTWHRDGNRRWETSLRQHLAPTVGAFGLLGSLLPIPCSMLF